MAATVWTDGSCCTGTRGERGAGGWAAVVERGSEGWVLRGAEPDTIPSRMELTAIARGLRSLPDGEEVVLRTDCTAVLSIREALDDHQRLAGARDGDLWLLVARELRRLRVEVRLVVKREVDRVHHRCHVIAGAEAKALKLERPPPTHTHRWPEPARERPPGHAASCDPVYGCVLGCPALEARVARHERRRLHASRRPSKGVR